MDDVINRQQGCPTGSLKKHPDILKLARTKRTVEFFINLDCKCHPAAYFVIVVLLNFNNLSPSMGHCPNHRHAYGTDKHSATTGP